MKTLWKLWAVVMPMIGVLPGCGAGDNETPASNDPKEIALVLKADEPGQDWLASHGLLEPPLVVALVEDAQQLPAGEVTGFVLINQRLKALLERDFALASPSGPNLQLASGIAPAV